MAVCVVCGKDLSQPLYSGRRENSISSLCEMLPGRTVVYFCEACGHLQSLPLAQLAEYYESHYRILLESDDEDQLYQIRDGRKLFRIEHQVQTFLSNIPLPKGARVLDYGCAKGASTKKLMQLRPDISAHLFDVSSMYLPFWKRFATEAQWSIHDFKPDWPESFDAVMSYYVMEHVVDPVAALQQMAGLLKPSGTLYWVVPNVFENPADFIVADHVNHFAPSSIRAAVARAGLKLQKIDGTAHQAAWIVVAVREPTSVGRCAGPSDDPLGVDSHQHSAQLASFWSSAEERVSRFEAERRDSAPTAIYGAGFYGTFVASRLSDLSSVQCFVDQNPYRQRQSLFEKPILAPNELPEAIQTVYVGLNPRVAQQIISEVTEWRDRPLKFFYL